MFEQLVIGLLGGASVGILGYNYVIFRRGWIQAMVFGSIHQFKADFERQIAEKPEILKPYVGILVKQFQDPEIARAIVGPLLGEAFKAIEGASRGDQGSPVLVPKKYKWIVDLVMPFIGPQLQKAMGGGALVDQTKSLIAP